MRLIVVALFLTTLGLLDLLRLTHCKHFPRWRRRIIGGVAVLLILCGLAIHFHHCWLLN
jgi:hypothetical protein